MTAISRAKAPFNLPRHTILLAAVGLVLFVYFTSSYWFVTDDAFISFRYARNLVDGHGLVYNVGERVEGYTNFAWVLILAGFMRLGVPPELISNVLSVACGIAILVVVLVFGAKSRTWADPLIWLAPLCLAANKTFCAWSSSGLETQFFSLLVLSAMLAFGGERARLSRWPLASSLLFGFGTLTRPDAVIFFGVAALAFGFDVAVLRRRRLVSLLAWAGLYVLIVGTHVGWRYGYYGYLLPNTFYAKVSGFWWAQSQVWFRAFLYHYGVLLFLPLLFFLKRDFTSVLFALSLVLYTAYLLYVGGDSHEFRLIDVALPFFYWLIQEAVGNLRDRWLLQRRPSWFPPQSIPLLGVLLVGITLRSNFTSFSHQFQIETGIASVESSRAYVGTRIEEGKFLRDLVRDGYLRDDTVLAVWGAGALPYYSRLTTIDLWGLNDAHIAHQTITTRRVVSHEKTASTEYLIQRGVAIREVLQGIVLPAGGPSGQAPKVYRHVTTPLYEGPLRCVKVKGRYLQFATTLSDAQFRERFSRFEIVF